MSDTDVTVVGAGPTGLLLAGDLARGGSRVTLLERRHTESNLTRAFAVHARTLEQLDARGLADDLIRTGTPVSNLRLFGTVELDLSWLPSRFPFVLITPQYELERLLEQRAVAAGVQVVRGARVVSVDQDRDGVRGVHELPDGGTGQTRSAYLVGTDGHRSTVREALGLDFPGAAVVSSLMLADVRLARPPGDVLTVNGGPDGFCLVVPFGDGWFRVIARDPDSELPDDAPVELDEIASVARRVLGTDFGMHDARWLSRFHSEERQARRYRVGRVLLAGDAAHVHSPAGGMGMNTGLQDAANLGWKLAAVVAGRGGERLLDSYHDERHPVGAAVLRASGGLLRAAMVRSRPLATARNAVVSRLIGVPRVRNRFGGQLSGIAIRYPPPIGDSRVVGMRAPDVRGDDGRRLAEALRDGRFVLVAPAGSQVPGEVDGEPRATWLPAPTRSPVLVRPDGYVAWVGDDRPGLRQALRTWGA